MGRFFPKILKKDTAIVSSQGFTDGLNRIAEGLERMAFSHGHVEWIRGFIPRIVFDPATLTGVTSNPFLPKPFDIKSIDEDGLITVTRCKFQIGSKYYDLATEPSIAASSGTLCAVIDTSSSTPSVTLAIDYEWTDTAPELVPYALYDLTASGSDPVTVLVTCDRRGGTISIYEP